jgi:SAM-dependent methyltransferase
MSVISRRNHALKRAEINQIRQELRFWYTLYVGKTLRKLERRALEPVLNSLFGYHAIQVGTLLGDDLLSSSRISHRLVMDPDKNEDNEASIYAYPDALPIASDSVDLVLLPHTLEFERTPHEILREVERVLIPEGHVVIMGFNPWSLWGAASFILKRRNKNTPPWCGRFITLTRIKDWLALLGFEVVDVKMMFYRPPLQQRSVLRRMHFVEKVGARFFPNLGGVYMLVAQKRVTTLTPIKPRWRPRRALVGKWMEPTAHVCNRNDKCDRIG